VPADWLDHSSLKFASADYVADVWLNGRYLGYHEGGSTPFALDAGSAVERGATNTLLVRVARPELGTRLDVVPWGLTDWWDYGGITGAVWLEGSRVVGRASGRGSPPGRGGHPDGRPEPGLEGG